MLPQKKINKVFGGKNETEKIGDIFVAFFLLTGILTFFCIGIADISSYFLLIPFWSLALFLGALPFLYQKERALNNDFNYENERFLNKISTLEQQFEKLEKNWNSIYKNIKNNLAGILNLFAKEKIKNQEIFTIKDIKPFLINEEFKILETLETLYKKHYGRNFNLNISYKHNYLEPLKDYRPSLPNMEEMNSSMKFEEDFKSQFSESSLEFILNCIDIKKGVFYFQNLVNFKTSLYGIEELLDSNIKENYYFLSLEDELKLKYWKYLDIKESWKSDLKWEIEEKLKQYWNKTNSVDNNHSTLNKIYL